MKVCWKKWIAGLLCTTMCTGMLPLHAGAVEEEWDSEQGTEYAENVAPHESGTDPQSVQYELYPIPQQIVYEDSTVALSETMTVFYGNGVDDYTKARAQETFGALNIALTEASAEQADVFVGIASEQDAADALHAIGANAGDAVFTEKIDGYRLKATGEKIYVVGRHTDAAFYGLTTLLQIFQQVDSSTRVMRRLDITDWADVASRGFIEGYYGDPWGTDDRVELMRWGGYYKLNSYFYAPKDDPKHNAQWWVLYDQNELETKIRPLAEAGNKSKCQFVYALHPYMHNAISSGNYETKLAQLKAKFQQTMDYGVRQIAVLADDANIPDGDGENGWKWQKKLMDDLTEWVSSEEMQAKYPGLKTTIPFCPNAYMNGGDNRQLQYFGRNMPATVPIVVTGGKVWGEVSQNFTQSFTAGVGRGPYMWINWPCTDNSKRHLIMGGYTNFLHVGVNPENIQGIILNPMQQSEPSKVAIFGNACYSWNIWTAEEAQSAYNASFKYVDHESYEETAASDALRELSKHMINQNMDGRVVALQESVEIKALLNEVRGQLDSGAPVEQADIDELRDIFTKLQNAAKTYQQEGNTRIREQIKYWLASWVELTDAILSYLSALEEIQSATRSSDKILDLYFAGNAAYEASNGHGFHYVDHNEYAEVGVQHIQPFTRSLQAMVSREVQLLLDPTALVETPIHSFGDEIYNGNTQDRMIDNNAGTYAYFGRHIVANDYVGVKFSRRVDLDRVAFLLGTNETHWDKMPASKLEYTTDGVRWEAVPDGDMESLNTVQKTDMNLKGVLGIRLTAKTGLAKWLAVREIQINDEVKEIIEVENPARIQGTAFMSSDIRTADGALGNILDGNEGSYAWFAESPQKPSGDPQRDKLPANAYFGFTFAEPKKIGRVVLKQDTDKDKIEDGVLEYQPTDGDEWRTIDGVAVSGNMDIDLSTKEITAKAIRVRNKTLTQGWVKVYEFVVEEYNPNTISATVIKSGSWSVHEPKKNGEEHLFDGNDETFTWYNPGNNDTSRKGDFIGLDLGKTIRVGKVRIVIGGGNEDRWLQCRLEYSTDNQNWHTLHDTPKVYTATSNRSVIEENLRGAEARYVRFVNEISVPKWIKFGELTVKPYDPNDLSVNFMYKSKGAKVTDADGVSDHENTKFYAKTIELPAGGYLGVDLGQISPVRSITLDTDNMDDAVKLKGGESRSRLSELDLAHFAEQPLRYLEFVNTGEDTAVFTLNELAAAYTRSVDPFFVETTMGIHASYASSDNRIAGDTNALFDGNINTKVSFSDYPQQDQYILYDLGKVFQIKNLKLYMEDNEQNYIRDGKIQVSMRKDGGWTDVITIGDGVENGNDASTTAMTGGMFKTSSKYPNNVYAEGSIDETPARYLRVLLTARYQHRFVSMNEIVINDGAYAPEQNAAFTAVPAEQSGFAPSMIADGRLTTGFRPDMTGATEGSLIYRLSETTDLEQINVVLDGSAVNASRPVTVYAKGSNTADRFVKVGEMVNAVNNIAVYNAEVIGDVYELKFTWNNITPTIYEVYLIPRGIVKVDLSYLTSLMNVMPAPEVVESLSDDYNPQSKQAYINAYQVAYALLQASEAPEYQAVVVETQNDLNRCYKELRAPLESALSRLAGKIAEADSLVEEQYDAASWNKYTSALNTAKQAQTKTELQDITEIKQAYEALAEAQGKLVKKSDEKQILSFSIPNAAVDINEETHHISVTVPAGTEVTALVPTIVVSEGAAVDPQSGIATDFTHTVTYTVTAENGSTQAYTVEVREAEADVYLICKDSNIVHGDIELGAASAKQGDTVSVTARPENGYALKENSIKVYKADAPEETVEVTENGFVMPAYDVVVSAVFEAVPYSIFYELGGGENHSANPTEYTVEQDIVLQNPQYEGRTFVGWTYGDVEQPVTDLVIKAGSVTGNLTFTAHWENVVTYKVTFNSAGGSAVDSQTVEKGQKAKQPAAPSRSGYGFRGWYTDEAYTAVYDFDAPVTGDLTLYARWAYVGSTSSGSSSSSSSSSNKPAETAPTKPETSVVQNSDGSVTTTTTTASGETVKSTQHTDGTTSVTQTQADGSYSETVTDAQGRMQGTAFLSPSAIQEAEQRGDAVKLPIQATYTTRDHAEASTVTVNLGAKSSAKVEIPITGATAGTVAIKVIGTNEKVIKNSVLTNDGLTATVNNGDTIKIVENDKEFRDVPKNYWGANAVSFANSRGLFSGTSETEFDPEVEMSRAMVVTVLARYEDVDTSTGKTWYDAGRDWAKNKGISDGSNMSGSLTREQLATMLYRYAGEPTVSSDLSAYGDSANVSVYARPAMAWAVDTGLINGVTGDTLAPQNEATRVQVAAILQRYIEKMA